MFNLVTGGSGFVGAHLTAALCDRGERVRVLDIDEPKKLPEGTDFVRASVTDVEAVTKAMDGIDTVFHLAANAHLWARNKADYDAINVNGTEVTISAASRARVSRIIHTSSLTVLVGNHGRRSVTTVDEKTNVPLEDMQGPYCRSKHLADQIAMAAAQDGAPVTVIMPTLPVGPGDFGLTPPTRLMLDLVTGKTPAYLQCLLNPIDVRDVALGAILARDRGAAGERYILGHQDIWMSDLLDELQSLTGVDMPKRRVPYSVALAAAYADETISDWITKKPPKASLTGVRLAGRKIRFDTKKAVSKLGLACRDREQTLRDQMKWFYEQRLTPTDLSSV